MDFAEMKRRDLQALCKRHGLPAGGTNTDLVARLAAALEGSGGAAAEPVGVVVGKGCLKRSAGGDSDAAKKVTFDVEEDEEAAVSRGRGRPQVTGSPAVPKTRGRLSAGETPPPPPAAKGNGGGRRRTRSQAGESDSGEAVADTPMKKPVPRKNSAKAEQEEAGTGGAAGRNKQLKRKTREDDAEDADASGQVGVSRRSTRSTGLLPEPTDALPSPAERKRGRRKPVDVEETTSVEERPAEALPSGRSTRSSGLLPEPTDALPSPVERKRGRTKAADVEEKISVEEQPTEALRSGLLVVAPVPPSGRALRSGLAVVAPVPPPTAPKSKKSKTEVQEEEPAVEKVAEVGTSRRATRSSAVAAPLASPGVVAKKRGRKADDVQLDGGPDKKKVENKRQSGRLATSSSIHDISSTQEEAPRELVAAPSKGLPPRPSRRNASEASVMLNGNTASESSRAPTSGMDEDVANKQKVTKPVGRSTRRSVAPVILEKESMGITKEVAPEDVEEKQIVTKPVGRSTRRSVAPVILEKESKGLSKEAIPEAVGKKPTVTKPAGRSTRRSVAPVIHKKENMGLTKEAIPDAVEKKLTVKKPVGRSTGRSVAPVILEKESKALTKEMVPEAHGKRPTRKSVVPAMLEKGRKSIITEILPEAPVKRSMRKPALPIVNSENNDHREVVSTENLQTDKSAELEKQPTVQQPVRRLTRKSAVPAMFKKDRKCVPDMVNDENGNRTEMQSDQAGHLEKRLIVKEHVGRSTGKSVAPDLIEKENKGLHEELKSEVSVSTPVCKSVDPNAVNKDNNEFVGREELSMHTSLQVALQNDESTRRTTRRSSKLVLSPPPSQQKPTASKGRPAKRRRTASLQESMPAEEQKEDRTNDVIEVATSTDLEMGVLPLTVEKSDLRDSQLNSELEGMVVAEPGLSCNENNSGILETELEGTVGTTEKPPSNLPIPVCQQVGALSEEAVHSIENDAGRCSPNFEQSPTVLQSLFSEGIVERSSTHNAIPCPQNSVEESVVHKVESRVETVVSSKSDLSQGSDENSVSVQESGGCAFLSQQNIELVSSCPKDLIPSAQLVPSEDADHVVRDVTTKDLISKEGEKNDIILSSYTNVPHEISPANEPENASGVSGAVFCSSGSTPISDEVNSDSSRLVSPDALDNRIASSNTEVVQQDNKEECNLHNGVTDGIHVSGMSEAAQLEVSKSGKVLLPDVETSAFRDEQLNLEREGNEFEEHSFRCGSNRSGKNNASQLANEYVTESCREQELKLPHDLSAVKSPKGSTTCQDGFAIGSGTGRTSGSIVKGNKIDMDAPGTAMQGDNLNPSATPLLRNREDTASLVNAPELSSDHFATNSSVRTVQSVSGKLSEAGLTVEDDAQVQEGTLEKAALGSVTPESKHECELPDEAEPHSLNERCSSRSSVEQSPFGLQPLFSQGSIEEPSENVALAVHAKNGVDESKDIPVGYEVEKLPVPESVSDHDTSVDFTALSKSDDCVYSSDQGLTKSCHGQEHMACQLDLLKAANCMDITNPEEPSYVEENKMPVRSTEISSSCEKIDANGPVKHDSVLGDDLLSSSLIASTDDTDVLLSSNPNQFETDFLDEPKGCSTTEALQQGLKEQVTLLSRSLIASTDDTDEHPCSNPSQFKSTDFLDESKHCSSTEALQGLKEQCDEPKENQDTYGACSSDMIEANTAKDLESEVPPLPAEEFDMPGDLVLPSAGNEDDSNTCHGEMQVENMDSSKPDDSSQLAHEKDEQLIAPLPAAEASTLPDEQANPELEAGEFEEFSFSNENISQLEHENDEKMVYSELDSSQLEHEKDEQLIAPLLAAEISTLPDEQANPELEAGELEKCSFSNNEDTSQLEHENDEKMVSSEPDSSQLEHKKGEHLLLAAETSTSPDEQANPELDADEFEKCNFSTEALQGLKEQCDEPKEDQDAYGACSSDLIEANTAKDLESEIPLLPAEEFDTSADLVLPSAENEDDFNTCHGELQVEKIDSSKPDSCQLDHEKDEQLIAPLLAAETSTLPDEQANPELESGEFEECSFSNENISQLEHVNDEKIVSSELDSSQLEHEKDEQLIVPLAAEISTLPDEQANPELEAGELEKCSFSNNEDTSQLEHENDEKMVSSEPDSSQLEYKKDEHLLLAAETSISPDEQANPELEAVKFEKCNFSNEDTSQLEHEKHEQLIAPLHAAETSPLPDEQDNTELQAGEFGKCYFSSEDTSGKIGTGYVNNLFQLPKVSPIDPIQGKELLNDLSAPESLEQSTIGQDAKTSAWPDEQPKPWLETVEFEKRNLTSEVTSGIFGTGYVNTNQLELHEEYAIQGKKLPDNLPAPKSSEQTTIGQAAERLAWLDEQPNTELEAFEEHLYTSEGTSGMFGSGYDDNLFLLHEYPRTNPIQGKELPDFLPAPKSPKQSIIGEDKNALVSETSPLEDEKFNPKLDGEEHSDSCCKATSYIFSSGSVKNNTSHWDDKEAYNENSDDQATAAMLSSGMAKPTQFEGSESGMALPAGTPPLTDEQLNSKPEDDKEANLFFDTDTSNYDTGLMETSDPFSFPEDAHTETCYEHELPIGTPAAKSAGALAVTPDGSVPGSVGTCQTSCRRRVDEISKELLRFKISSAVKGSYIAMDPADTKQGDNQSSISLLGNSNSVPAANAELSMNHSAGTDLSRQGTTDGL